MLYSLSSFSTCTFDQISAVHTGPKIFQLYVWKDRAFLRDLLSRARENGFELLALTADLSWFGNRERERKAGFTIPPAYTVRQCADALTSPAWSFDFLSSDAYTYALIDGSARADSISSFVNAQIDAGFNWADAEWLCAEWGGPVLLKGVVRPDNAKHAIQSGFAGVWVSNHGGRQLETAPAPIQVLPAIRYALGPTPWVVMDGGVQRGVDIAKAIALGADGVAVGKPALYGLGGGGENGVRKAFSILSEELERAMGLLGVGTVDELKRQGPSLVVRRPSGVSGRGVTDGGGGRIEINGSQGVRRRKSTDGWGVRGGGGKVVVGGVGIDGGLMLASSVTFLCRAALLRETFPGTFAKHSERNHSESQTLDFRLACHRSDAKVFLSAPLLMHVNASRTEKQFAFNGPCPHCCVYFPGRLHQMEVVMLNQDSQLVLT
eukprot:6214769-Pleurochrysis_carterae.AAC.5